MLIFVNIVLRIFVYKIVPHRLYHVISCNLSIYNKVSVVLFKTHGLFKCLLVSRISTWYLEPTERQLFTVLYPVDPLSSGEKFLANRVITPVCLPYIAVTHSGIRFRISPVTTGLPLPSAVATIVSGDLPVN